MVVMEALGLASKEVFEYNRENFNFDNWQRIDMEKTRLSMQVERFNLFREDIEDLVDLTVSKMDMYHAVAALLLGSACTLYTEGRMHVPGNTPPWYIAIYFISIAGTFCYLLLTVWLSMYASVASHSFGVRLRTRYVRLPIPSLAQLQSITAKMQDFEKQGAKNVMRIPFGGGAPEWQLENELHHQRQIERRKSGQSTMSLSAASSSNAGVGEQPMPGQPKSAMNDWLSAGEAAFGKHEIVTNAAAGPGQHVQLFRRLQARWQCYDAYARVSMSMGINQLLQSMTYYLLGATLIENDIPSAAIALTLIYQCAALAVLYLDVAGVSKIILFLIQLIGTAPAVLVLIALATAEREPHSGLLSYENVYEYTPASFFCEVLWYEALLWITRPSDDEATLPRRFRSVLFLDVFGDAHYDPTEAEQVLPDATTERDYHLRRKHESHGAAAERHVAAALSALRRWEAVPGDLLNDSLIRQLRRARQDFEVWRRALIGHLIQQKNQRGVSPYDLRLIEEDVTRSWTDLTSTEQEHDAFADFLLGPFDKDGRVIYFDLEAGQRIYQDLPGREVLSLKETQGLVKRTENVVQSVLSGTDVEEDADFGSEGGVGVQGIERATSGLPTKVERLPWKVLKRMTRCFQLCWLFLGIMNIMYIKGYNFDQIRWAEQDKYTGLHVGKGAEEKGAERRLESVALGTRARGARLEFRSLDVEWPHGMFFQPSAMAMAPANQTGKNEVLLSSPFVSNLVPDFQKRPLRLVPLPVALYPAGSIVFCGPEGNNPNEPDTAPCFAGKLSARELVVWTFGAPHTSIKLPMDSETWGSLTGAIVLCMRVAGLLPTTAEAGKWCLVLAGWDGQNVPVAAIPLQRSSHDDHWQFVGVEAILPRLADPTMFRASPICARAGKGKNAKVCLPVHNPVAALHVDPTSGRLWRLSETGDIELWDLRSLRRLGGTQPRWPVDASKLRALALCEVPELQKILVAGQTAAGPRLFEARLHFFSAVDTLGVDVGGQSFAKATLSLMDSFPPFAV